MLLPQAEEKTPHRRGDGDAVRSVSGGDGIAAGRPASRGQIGILLQSIAPDVRPENHCAFAYMRDAQTQIRLGDDPGHHIHRRIQIGVRGRRRHQVGQLDGDQGVIIHTAGGYEKRH